MEHKRQPFIFFIALFLFLFGLRCSSQQEEPATDPEEAAAVFEILQAINSDIDWKGTYPGDPCTGGPHGIVCDTDTGEASSSAAAAAAEVYHVVELQLGWISDYSNNPRCGETASISLALLRLRHLRRLLFYRCFVHSPASIPSQLGRTLTSLQQLSFRNNPTLVGSIPPDIGALPKLERLVITGNHALKGRIPTELGSLTSLRQLVLSDNHLSGAIPSSLASLKSLVILDLSANRLSGEIPSELLKLPELRKLDLSRNKLQAALRIPQMNASSSLRFLDLSFNNLSGSLPSELRHLRALSTLFLGSNPLLSGALPDIWSELGELMSLGLSGCSYEGLLPPSLGDLHKLNSLSIGGNLFSGRIPDGIGRLPNLYHLNISGNPMLVGAVPFTPALLKRMGRNLVVGNGSNLCYREQLRDTISKASGLHPCQEHPDLPQASASRLPTSNAVPWLLMLLLLLRIGCC